MPPIDRIAKAALLASLALFWPASARAETITCEAAHGTRCQGALVGLDPWTSTMRIRPPTSCPPGQERVLQVQLDIVHPRVSTLFADVRAPDGTGVRVLERYGSGAQPDGCTRDDVNAIFSDRGTPDVCAFTIPALFGKVRPSNSLARIEKAEHDGVWILRLEDRRPESTTYLRGWGINFCDVPLPEDGGATSDGGRPPSGGNEAPPTLPSSNDGCGCRVTETTSSAAWAACSLVLLGALGALRRFSRRRDR